MMRPETEVRCARVAEGAALSLIATRIDRFNRDHRKRVYRARTAAHAAQVYWLRAWLAFSLLIALPSYGCAVAVEPAPQTYCERTAALGCDIDCEREPSADRCDLRAVEECVRSLEAAPDCETVEELAAAPGCYGACEAGR